ncbi:MAG: ROK family protein [Acidimicrobiia bacterium]|nr:ROK family protein [Acidimicrobiia bacterium]MYC44399.1 ROK family protein [Acidimicrobiia bacterium]MYI18943.1 ROK family protein [Acidimicrobiia bacterium]
MMSGRLAGFDIGGTNIRAEVLASGAGAHDARRSDRPGSMAGIVEVICEMVCGMEEALAEPVAALGVGCAGLVDRSGVVATSPNIPAIADFPLRSLLTERLRRPVVVENDATAALRGEMEGGAASGLADALLVTFGTGIGAALLLDGEIRRGAHGLAGEAGHMIVAPDGPECLCGRRGCWEQLASGEALGRAARQAAGAGKAPALRDRAAGRIDALRGEHVGELATAGDPVARRLLREFSSWVALGLNNLILVLSPEVIVLGGGLSELGEVFLAPVRDALAKIFVEQGRRPSVEVRRARHGDRAGVIGAAHLARDALGGPDLHRAGGRAR